MKKILIFIVLINSLLFGLDDNETSKQKRIDKQIQIEIETEKRYAQEQIFYNAENYNFKGSEVNPELLKYVPELELDDLDMDSVYD